MDPNASMWEKCISAIFARLWWHEDGILTSSHTLFIYSVFKLQTDDYDYLWFWCSIIVALAWSLGEEGNNVIFLLKGFAVWKDGVGCCISGSALAIA